MIEVLLIVLVVLALAIGASFLAAATILFAWGECREQAQQHRRCWESLTKRGCNGV